MPSSKTFLAAALGALALCGAGATAASADSISYVKGGNVWLSTPDGSRQFQVTTSGAYASASQSDDGTIAAISGQRIHRLDRYGNVLSNFSTPVSDGTDDSNVPYVSHFIGPFDADISDDGQKVAYSFYWQYWTTFGSTTGYHMLRQGVGLSKADRLTAWSEPGLGYLTGWFDSSWYDGDTLVVGREASVGQTDVSLHNLGAAANGQTPWFVGNSTLTDLREPAVNRQHSRVAFVGGTDAAPQLWVQQMNGEAPALPSACHGWENPAGGVFTSLTWSPSGTALAWEEGDGIWVATGNERCGTPDATRRLIAGGTYPDWGPASVPASRPAPPDDGGGDGGTGGGDGGAPPPSGGTPTTGATPIATTRGATGTTGASAAGVSGSTARAKGPTFSFSCGRACTITGKATAPVKLARRLGLKPTTVLASGRVRLGKKGKAKLVVTPTAVGRRALARLQGQTLTLKVTIKEGRRTRRVTRRVVLG